RRLRTRRERRRVTTNEVVVTGLRAGSKRTADNIIDIRVDRQEAGNAAACSNRHGVTDETTGLRDTAERGRAGGDVRAERDERTAEIDGRLVGVACARDHSRGRRANRRVEPVTSTRCVATAEAERDRELEVHQRCLLDEGLAHDGLRVLLDLLAQLGAYVRLL